MLFPEERMFVFPVPFPIKAKYFVMGYVVIELYLGVSGSADGVAHFAHLGGMLFGFILIFFWRNKGKIRGPYV
jgi:membrane associated rhomboid family serine protease